MLEYLQIDGNLFTPNVKKIIEKLNPFDWIIISEMKVDFINGHREKLENPIFLQIL